MAKKRKSTRKKGKARTRRMMAAGAAAGGCSPGSPDRRFPVHGDSSHEIVCKCIGGSWLCRQVAAGGDWSP
jgi:hypothetical protein